MEHNNIDIDEVYPYKQGIAIVRKGNCYGAIMVGGKQILPPIYESLTDFENGFATAKFFGEERVINLSGQVQVRNGDELIFLPEEYDWGWDFEEGGCVVIKDTKIGAIDNNFNVILSVEFELIKRLNSQFFLCRKEWKECVVNRSGIIIFSLDSEESISAIGSFFLCSDGGRSRIIDFHGNELLRTKYGEYLIENKQINNHNILLKIKRDNNGGITNFLLNSYKGIILEENGILNIIADAAFVFAILNSSSLYKIDCEGNIYLISAHWNKSHFSDEDIIELSKAEGIIVTKDYLYYRFTELTDGYLSVYDTKRHLYGLSGKDGRLLLSPQYDSLLKWTDESYIVSITSEDVHSKTKSKKYGIINKDGKELLPFNYESLGILVPQKILTFSLRTKKLTKRLWGLLNSNYTIICPPLYDRIETTDSSNYFKTVVDDLWGVIDINGIVIIPNKFGKIAKSQKPNAPFLVSLSKYTEFNTITNSNYVNEKGEFVVCTTDGIEVCISSQLYDWCGNFSELDVAEVKRNGLYGKINKDGSLIALNNNHPLLVPQRFSWAYDFKLGYAAVQKDSKWGIVDDKYKIVIPCEYEYVDPLCPGFFVFKKNKDGAYGLIDANNSIIADANYKSIKVRDEYFMLDDTLINSKGERVLPFPVSDYEVIEIGGETFWTYESQHGGYGVYSNENTVIPAIYKKIVYEEGHFQCSFFSQHHNYDDNRSVYDNYQFTINTKGEIILNRHGRNFTVPSEYDMAFDAGYGLIKVKRNGKWGLLNYNKELVTDTQYAYISDYRSIYAIVGVGEVHSHVCHRSDERALYGKMVFGLIDINGKEVLAPVNEFLVVFDNGYICYLCDGKYGLMSPALKIIVPPQFHSIKMIDKYHFVVDDTGLIDINGNIIIPVYKNRYDSPYKIDVLTDGYYKLTKKHDNYCESSIVNSFGKTILPFERYIEDLKMLDNGLILATIRYYNHSDYNFNIITLQGNKIFQVDYAEMKFMEDGLISIRGKDGWGIADILGNIIFEPKYINELEFKDSVSDIQVRGSSYAHECDIDGRIYVKNGEGRVALPDVYYWGTDFINGVSVVRRKNSYRSMGVIDVNNSIIVPADYESITLYSNNVILVKKGDYFGAYDLKGNMILPLIFIAIKFVSENIIWVKWNTNKACSWDNNGFVSGENDNDYINYDLDSDPINQAKSRTALCTLDGHVVSDSNLAFIGRFDGYYAITCKEILVEDFNIKYRQIGVVNIEGNTVLEPIYNKVKLFKGSSFAEVVIDKKIGIADLTNHKIVMLDDYNVKHIWEIDRFGRCLYSDEPCKYDSDTKEWYDGNEGVLTSDDIIVKPGKYDSISLLDNGLIMVRQIIGSANLYGLLDFNGKELLPMKYSSISPFEGDYASLCLDGKWGVVNSKGIFIQECVNDSKIELDVPIRNNDETDNTSLPTPTILISEVFPEDKYGNDYYDSYYDDDYYGNYYDDGYSQDELNDMYRDAFDGNPEYESNID